MPESMTIDELIARLEEIREANREPDVPSFDPGSLGVHIQSEDGTYDSEILSVESVNDVWLIIKEPNYGL